MNIQTSEDWWQLAETTIPKLPSYVAQFRPVQEDILLEELNKSFEAKNWEALHSTFQDVWNYLPDNASIHIHPFSDLCDLCSEIWVFEKGDLQ